MLWGVVERAVETSWQDWNHCDRYAGVVYILTAFLEELPSILVGAGFSDPSPGSLRELGSERTYSINHILWFVGFHNRNSPYHSTERVN